MAETPRLPSPEIRAALAQQGLEEALAALDRLRAGNTEALHVLERIGILYREMHSKKPSVSRG